MLTADIKPGLRGIKIWTVLGTAFALLQIDGEGPRSPLWFLAYALFGLLLLGLWHPKRWRSKRRHTTPEHRAPQRTNWRHTAWLYSVFAWTLGMLGELALTRTGEGLGGNHQHSVPSFILSQGIYIPLILATVVCCRRKSLTFAQVFYLTAGMGLVEGLVFRPAVFWTLLSPFFWLTPLTLAFAMVSYPVFLATPFLFLRPGPLWRAAPENRSVVGLLALGFVIALLCYLFWGLAYGPLVESIFELPPIAEETL